MEQLIRNGLEAMDLLPQTPDRAPAQLAEYGRLLLEKNQVMNLTAITEPERVAQLHMLDSAALLKGADFQDKTLIDVGTGAGFPGIPLKILVPSLQVTLLDSLNKRVDWLGHPRRRRHPPGHPHPKGGPHPEGLSPPVGQDPEGSAVRARSVPYPAHTSNSITKYTENSHHITKKPLTNPRFVIDLFW